MRIVKEFTLGEIHVTIFKMGQKFTLKLEWNRFEQVFKLDARDGVEKLEHVMALMDKTFLEKVKSVFESMLENKNNRLSEWQEISGDEFPEII